MNDFTFSGNVDVFNENELSGWARYLESDKKADVWLLVDGKIVLSATANIFRKDLTVIRHDGMFAFEIEIPLSVQKILKESNLENIKLVDGRVNGEEIDGARYFNFSYINNVSETSKMEDIFISDVIEDILWIDKPDWMDVLALRHRRGEFSDEICDRIFHFIRDGFIVIPNAVDLETVHKVNEEINSKWEYPPKDLFIETFEPDSKINVIPADIEYKTGRTKMLDVYAHSDIVRSAINNEPTRQFLTAIFGDAPKAFQSLNFWFGSGQPIHKDSAYVKIDKEPTKFAASWIALEDIVVGSGELEYFVGSHKAPPYLFGGKNKWLESNPSEHNDFLISLYRDATLYNQTHQKFIARAGDVLIWHADLSHGGTKVIKNNTTRLSLVTHFTPKSSSPYFYRKRRFIEKDDGDMVFVSQYSDIN